MKKDKKNSISRDSNKNINDKGVYKLNKDGHHLVELIYESCIGQPQDTDLRKQLKETIEGKLNLLGKNLLLGPYIPLIKEIFSEERDEIGDIVEQTVKFPIFLCRRRH